MKKHFNIKYSIIHCFNSKNYILNLYQWNTMSFRQFSSQNLNYILKLPTVEKNTGNFLKYALLLEQRF
jgi:hypothetical protein